jgi:hypothetical protein
MWISDSEGNVSQVTSPPFPGTVVNPRRKKPLSLLLKLNNRSLGIAVRSVDGGKGACVMAVADPEEIPRVFVPSLNVRTHPVMSELVRVPIVPLVVMLPITLPMPTV